MIVPYLPQPHDVAVPESAHTLAGFREWIVSGDLPEEVTAHLIEREVFIEMSPERIETHSLVKYEISWVVGALIRKGKLGAIYPDGVWLTNDEAELSTEADACFASWDSHRSGRVVLTSPAGEDADEIELRGSPDWVLEIVSPHSVKKDTRLLPIAYYLLSSRRRGVLASRRPQRRGAVHDLRSRREGVRRGRAGQRLARVAALRQTLSTRASREPGRRMGV